MDDGWALFDLLFSPPLITSYFVPLEELSGSRTAGLAGGTCLTQGLPYLSHGGSRDSEWKGVKGRAGHERDKEKPGGDETIL